MHTFNCSVIIVCVLVSVALAQIDSGSWSVKSVFTNNTPVTNSATFYAPNAVSTVVYEFDYNVTSATKVKIDDISILFGDNERVKQIPFSLKKNASTTLVGTYSANTDPCLFPTRYDEPIYMQFSATTDSPKVDVGSIENGSAFQYVRPTVGPFTRFYTLDVEAPAVEYSLHLTVESTGYGIVTLAGGDMSCPTAWSQNNNSVHETQAFESLPIHFDFQIKKFTRFWVQYIEYEPCILKFTWKATAVSGAVPQKVIDTNRPTTDSAPQKHRGFTEWLYKLFVVQAVLGILLVIGLAAVIGLIIFSVVKRSAKGYKKV